MSQMVTHWTWPMRTLFLFLLWIRIRTTLIFEICPMCVMTHPYVTRLMRDTTHPRMWHDLLRIVEVCVIFVPWLTHVCHDSPVCAMTAVWHDSHLTFWHDSCVTWLICTMPQLWRDITPYLSRIKAHEPTRRSKQSRHTCAFMFDMPHTWHDVANQNPRTNAP